MNSNRRRRLFVEPRMQGLLIFKVLVYWLTSFVTIGLMLTCFSIFNDQPRNSTELFAGMWAKLTPALAASMLLLPLIVIDCIRWSNRYAGPMVRLHAALTKLADGGRVTPLKFRQGDLWAEMAQQFNRIAARMPTDTTSGSTGDAAGHDEWADEEIAIRA
jgi:hypothetical protein